AVLAYLARYTHRVAISNSRLLGLDERGVTFRYKDYRRDGRARLRTMTLAPGEFIRRFLLHVLPKGFHRIRHYGLLASATCKKNIARARELIAMPVPVTDPPVERDEADPAAGATADRPPCPCCGGRMIIVGTFERAAAPRAPPSPDTGVRTAMPSPPSPPHRTTHLPGNLASGIAALLTGGLPGARVTPSIMPKTPRQRPARRQNPDPDRRSVAQYDGQCSPYPRRCPGKSP